MKTEETNILIMIVIIDSFTLYSTFVTKDLQSYVQTNITSTR